MAIGKIAASAALILVLFVPGGAQEAKNPSGAAGAKSGAGWQAAGTLFEACSCNVPCPCNFGQSPTRDYCHTVYAYRLKTARYEGVSLDGLIIAGGEGDKGAMGFLDARAAPEQKAALEKLALALFAKGGASSGPRRFTFTRLAAEDNARTFKMEFGDSGGVEADILLGADRKKPIIVENNTTWPVHRFLKGKTSRFDYKDALGNRLNYTGVNANLGEFTLSGPAEKN
jgi:hypothetical protein